MLALGRNDGGGPLIWGWNDSQPGSWFEEDEEHRRKRLSLKDLYSNGYIELDSLRSIKEEDIMDRSKGDFLSKVFALFQTSWFILGCIARHHQGLPLAELEIITLASAALNCGLYLLWWYKPQDLERRTYLTILEEPGPKPRPNDTEDDAEEIPLYTRASRWCRLCAQIPGNLLEHVIKLCTLPKSCLSRLCLRSVAEYIKGAKDITDKITDFLLSPTGMGHSDTDEDDITLSCDTQFFAVSPSTENGTLIIVGLTLAFAATFGAIHLTAWDFAFPSRKQLIIWRMASVVLTTAPVIPFSCYLLSRWKENHPLTTVGFATTSMAIHLYITARLGILVLAFVTLRDPDPQVFVEISWTCYIRHL